MQATKLLYGALPVLALMGSASLADDAKKVWTFDSDAVGKAPNGFKQEVGLWQIANVDGQHVLAQRAKNPNSVFNVVLVTDTHAKDIDLAVRMKPDAGDIDQGGGLIWRAKDKSNYYLARYNPLEDNFRLYKVEKGKRSTFKNADIKPGPGWHTLRVTMKGDHMECFLDGKKYLEADDSTFPDAGMIGLWSKADAQSYFDDLALVSAKAD